MIAAKFSAGLTVTERKFSAAVVGTDEGTVISLVRSATLSFFLYRFFSSIIVTFFIGEKKKKKREILMA